MPYIPHTEEDVAAMLSSIGAPAISDLFDEIPKDLLHNQLNELPEAASEMAMLKQAQSLAEKNSNGICFLGAGSYEHHIPAAVWDISSRGEFLTAYTPYQAEASQGTLQLLYEFQSMIAELTGLDVANASLYDGASALAEAVLMVARLKAQVSEKKILVLGALHPHYLETVKTIVHNRAIEIISLPFDSGSGCTALSALEAYADQNISAVVIAQPNFFGALEDVDAISDWAHAHSALVIAAVNPVSLGLLKPPGDWGQAGADIACGEGQPFGCPMASGGPYFGFISTKQQYVRQLPGRLIGRTVDKEGKMGFSLTLQAREQHIRREKATSNICTNQGLLVTAASIHMSLLGPKGLEQVAQACHQNTAALTEALCRLPGVRLAFTASNFHEAVLQFDRPVAPILAALRQRNILGGLDLSPYFPELGHCLLVCATEMRSLEEIQYYQDCLAAILQELSRSENNQDSFAEA